MRELNKQFMEIINQLEFEKKCEVELVKINMAKIGKYWPVNELGHIELEQLKLGMEELEKSVTKQMQKIFIESSNAPALDGDSSSNGGQADV
ncbi:hypothetical protein A4A49_51594 [Nicotiana attenuata]|uniref:Uncharacterized protein n=1 Tax=Nicotiana attenuata TaxID=49451 RepID=A0A314KSC8_NICAT|nr:hypothetical protein A4A49_51594 [Nicotiana attenuata]